MTTNQHYIPRFFQKYWECERRGYIWELDKRYVSSSNKGIRQQAIRSRNSEKCLYEADEMNPTNINENWYNKFETIYSKHWERLIQGRLCLNKISETNKRVMCRFFAHLSARHPLNLYQNAFNNMLASHFTLGEPNKIIDRRHIQNLIAFYEGGMMEVFGDDEIIFGDFEKGLRSCNLQILVAEDESVVFCDALISQVGYINEYYCPICPTMVAFFSESKMVKDKTIRKITEEEYRKIARLYLVSSKVRKIYAKSKSVLERISTFQL